MKSKILVADDNEDIRVIVSEALEKSDAIVESIGNGEAAFNFLNEFNADVVLVNSGLAGLSGSQLSEKIKRSKKYYTAKVILLIAESEDFTDKQYLESMADDLVFKPFRAAEIFKKIKGALGKRLVEAMEDIEMDWKEMDIEVTAADTKAASHEDSSDDDSGLEGIEPIEAAGKAKEMEESLLKASEEAYDDDGDDGDEDDDENLALADDEMMDDDPAAAKPAEDVALAYFMASGKASSKTAEEGDEDSANEDDDIDAGTIAPENKRDFFFYNYVKSINSLEELKEVFDKILYLDSSMRKREISDLSESMTDAILDAIEDVTPGIVRDIILKEIERLKSAGKKGKGGR